MTNSPSFQHVAVLMGGPSRERDVSLASGKAVADALASRGYDITRIDVTEPRLELPESIDAVFIALHGTFGEDGTVQSILEDRKIPFTGPGSRASRLAFDKIASKRLFEEKGIPTARYQILNPEDEREIPLPAVIKPSCQGSSIGISVVRSDDTWRKAIAEAFTHDDEVLAEVFIAGRELTVGIVGSQVLPIVEIRAPEGNYDYHAKYTRGVTQYLVPAPLDPETTRTCQEIAWGVYEGIGCRGMSRVDFRLDDDGHPYVLEINTIPGFTETSLLPKAAAEAGLPFPDLCETILNLATWDDVF